MKRIFVNVQRVGSVGDRGDYLAVVGGDQAEDISVTMLADPKLLQSAPHAIVKEIADRDSEVGALIATAIGDGCEVLVNKMPAMDHDAYRELTGSAFSPA